jgi:pyrroline-5-carboxylate reductase
MIEAKIGFIGAGNMAMSLVGGLLQTGVSASQLVASDPVASSRERMHTTHGINCFSDNADTVRASDLLILAIKPQVFAAVIRPLATLLQQQRPLLISIAAGIPTHSISTWLDAELPIIRCMPNTPALVGMGATGLFANPQVSAKQRELGAAILHTVGITHWFTQEKELDAVTAISGSGPAYFFLFMEAMLETATSLGLNPDVARALISQTALGAARLVQHSPDTISQLREQVTSPGGTTAAALDVFEKQDLRQIVAEALHAAMLRAQTLAKET